MDRIEYMMGGPLGIALLNGDIHSVHPNMPGDAICSLYLKCHGSLSLSCEAASGVRRGSFKGADCSFRFTDIIHPDSPVFIRRVECLEGVSFGISAPSAVRRRLFMKGAESSMLLSSALGSVCITLRGRGSFSPDGSIRFGAGKSDMIICSLTGDIYAGFPGVPPAADEVYERVMAGADPRIRTRELRDTVNRICDGGVLHDFAGCEYIISEQYDAACELCGAALYESARGVLRFMHRVYDVMGFLPISYSWRVRQDPFPEIRGVYPALALKAYYDACGDRGFVRELLPMAVKALCDVTRLIKGGHLPHMGDEGVVGKGLYEPSDKSERLFIHAARAVIDMSEGLKMRIGGISRLKRAALSMGNPCHAQRMPIRSLFTLCEECEREGICYLGVGGRYLCPECYIK